MLRSAVAVAALSAMVAPTQLSFDARPLAPPSPTVPTKRIAVTFDDLPRGNGAFYTKPERAARLLAALRDARIEQAAFFVNPGRIDHSDIARIAAYVAAGHVLGDHSFAHHDLSTVSAAAFLADIDKAEAWLRGQPGYRPWFRFPGLNQGGRDRAKRAVVMAGLAARDLMVAPVTADGLDWHMERLAANAHRAGAPIDFPALRTLYVETMVQAADFSDAQMRRIIGRSPAQVLLLHDTDLAASYIGALATGLRADGWQIVTADAAFADPVYHRTIDTPAVNGTLVEALGAANGTPGRLWYDRTDVKVADALFATRVLHHPVVPSSTGVAQTVPVRHARSVTRRKSWHRAAPPLPEATPEASGKTA